MDAGKFDESDLPDSIRRLINPNDVLRACTYDGSSFGYQNEQEGDVHDGDNCDQSIENVAQSSGVVRDGTAVNEIPLKVLRSMLIEHFDVSFQNNKVVWPTRLASRPRHVPSTVIDK